ncbi:hypothetical protein GCM10010191_36760 [Actinomadura vinacea]|uniref:Uncharacterized protein n=1 Tax=Actinomadura vinacea TaxID=115336 RepID=A0ABP5WBI2_9ACTN
MPALGSFGVTMTARADTTVSAVPVDAGGCCPVEGREVDGLDESGAAGACDPGAGVEPGRPGSVDADGTGVGVGPGVAWATPETATAEIHVAANAAPHTSTLRTPGPFLAEPGAHIIEP